MDTLETPENRSLAPLERMLDQTAATLQVHKDVAETMEVLFLELFTIRQQVSADIWKEVVIKFCRRHPLVHLLHQDPFTFRAFSKPRGYAGDAVLLDFIYAPEDSLRLPAWETAPCWVSRFAIIPPPVRREPRLPDLADA